jgi:homoserine kinase
MSGNLVNIAAGSPLTRDGRMEIRVAASSANLGPGFDTLGVALQLYLMLHVEVVDGVGGLEFDFGDLKLDGENAIERAFRFLARQQPRKFPSLRVKVHSEIPMKGGLGSSSAATVAGLRLFEAVAGALPEQGLLNAATALEGHPDNVAAALLGGLVMSCQLTDISVYAARLHWPEPLELLVLTPDMALATATARAVLPDLIPRTHAVFNIQRVSLLLQSLQSGNFELLREGLRDRLHQPFRQKLVPGLEQILALEHPDLLGACLSGAGPSIAVFAVQNFEAVEREMRVAYEPLRLPYTIRRLRVHHEPAHEERNTHANTRSLCV